MEARKAASATAGARRPQFLLTALSLLRTIGTILGIRVVKNEMLRAFDRRTDWPASAPHSRDKHRTAFGFNRHCWQLGNYGDAPTR